MHIEQGLYVAMGRVGGEGQRGKQRLDAGVAQGVVQDQRRVRRRQPRHLLTSSAGARRADSNRDGQCGGEALGWRARRRGRSNGERRERGHPPAVRRARERLCGAGGGDGVLDSVGFEPIGETTAKEKTKLRRKNEPDLAALARRATGSICWGGGGLGDGSGRSRLRKKTRPRRRRRDAGLARERGEEVSSSAREVERRRMRSRIRARKMRARTQGMPTC